MFLLFCFFFANCKIQSYLSHLQLKFTRRATHVLRSVSCEKNEMTVCVRARRVSENLDVDDDMLLFSSLSSLYTQNLYFL
jgi:hypothetical protein